MTTSAYKPREGSLASRLINYFLKHPDEELSTADIAVKYDCLASNVKATVASAVHAGALKMEGKIYSAGPAITECVDLEPDAPEGDAAKAAGVLGAHNVFSAHRPPADPTKKEPVSGGAASPRHNLDLSKLKVEENIPYMPHTGLPGESKWAPVFDLLQKPGQSVALPRTMKSALAAAALKRNRLKQGTFKVALVSQTEARIWRTA